MITYCFVYDHLFGDYQEMLRVLKWKLSKKPPTNDPDKTTDSLHIKILEGRDYIGYSQRKQIKSLLNVLNLPECLEPYLLFDVPNDLNDPSNRAADLSSTSRRVVGALLYIAIHSRSYTAFFTIMLA